MKMKKILLFALVFCLLVSSLAGCGFGINMDDSANGEKMQISVFAWELDAMGSDPEAPVYKALSEKFNVEFVPVSATQSQWKEKLNLLFASNDVPDLFLTPGFETVQFKKWAAEGFLLPISDYADGYMNIENVLDKYKNLTQQMSDGKHYGIPSKNGEGNDDGTLCNHLMWIRKDWLKNLNLKKPTTTDELLKVATAFANDDPDGNGKKDTYGYSANGTWWLYPVFNMFDASYYSFENVDGQYMPECLSEDMREGVKYLHNMYLTGALDPDFVINTEDQLFEKFITGKIGIFYNAAGPVYNKLYDKFKSAYPDKEPKDLFDYCEVMTGPNGKKRIDGKDAYFGITCINNNVDEAKREKILSILDYMLSEEGMKLMSYGIEGVHYKEENGEIINLIAPKADGSEQLIGDIDATAKMKTLVDWTRAIDNTIPNKEEYLASYESPRENAKTDPLRYISLDEEVFGTPDKKVLGDMTLQAVTDMIMTEEENIDTMFDDYVKQWKATKGELYISEINRLAKEQ